MTMQTLAGLGWEWRENGVVLSVQLQGQKPQQVFVPLNRVWHEFHKELAAVGCPLPAAVGAEITVGGFFSSIAHAVKSVSHAVTHNALTKAASSVVSTAANYAAHAINKIPIVGPLATSVTRLMTQPLQIADALAKGGRIDRVAMQSLKSSLASVKQIAPYAQTVLSVVPGVGQGLSGAIGAGLALASGQSLNDALVAGVRGALPGGPLAAAAFDVASAAMQGKPISQVALNALPISPQAKAALVSGLHAAKDLAAGKNVSQVAIDAAMANLPPDVHKAIQIGGALGHAKNLQSAFTALSAASVLASKYSAGVAAAKAIKALPAGARVPPALTSAVRQGLASHAAVTQALAHAKAGVPDAAKVVAALAFHKQSIPAGALPNMSRPALHVGAPHQAPHGHRHVRPRYHSAPTSVPAVGGIWGAPIARVIALRASHAPAAHTHPIAAAFRQLQHHHMSQRSSVFA